MAFQRYKTKVTIDGTDVTSAIETYAAPKKVAESSSASATVRAKMTELDNLVALTNGMEITIQRGTSSPTEETIFKGTVEIVKKGKPRAGLYELECRDKLYQLVKANVDNVFLDSGTEAGKISEIFKTLVTTYGGLNADGTTIQDSGTEFTIERFVCKNADVMERCLKLANTLDWVFYYNPSDDKVYFETKQYNTNSNVLLSGSNGNVYDTPVWKFDSDTLIQKVIVNGVETEVEKTETFSGDGSTATFTLSKKPESVQVTVDGTEQTGGVDNATSNPDYTVDKEDKSITFTSGNEPASGTDNIEVRMTYIEPMPVVMQDDESIESYGYVDKDGNRQPYTRTFNLRDVRTVSDAETRGRRILDAFKDPLATANVKVRNIDGFNLALNQQIRIRDEVNDEDRLLMIREIVHHWPSKYDEVVLGDKIFDLNDVKFSTSERIRRLEEERLLNEGIVTQVRTLNLENRWVNRYIKLTTRDINDSFVLGHSQNGLLGTVSSGTQPLLGDRRGSKQLIRVLQGSDSGNPLYEEEFLDTVFKGTVGSGGKWDTTNNYLGFSTVV